MSTIIALPPLANNSSADRSGEDTAISSTSTTTTDFIARGLLGVEAPEYDGTQKLVDGWIVPGKEVEDQAWKYRRSLPTMLLYSEQGLRLYDRITEEVPEYYLYPAELNLFKTKGAEIARAMGYPTGENVEREREAEERGWDVVELGAGSLKKTSHFLLALTSTLTSTTHSPISYHPLDLSRPELERTLADVESTFGDKLEGKVQFKALWGDYERGLEFIRQGGLVAPTVEERRGRADTKKDVHRQNAGLQSPSPVQPSCGPGSITKPMSPPYSDRGSLPSGDDSVVGDGDSDEGMLSENASASVTLSEEQRRPLQILFLGSSLSNFDRESAAPFLSSLPLRPGSGDTLLLGLDGRPKANEGTDSDYSHGKAKVDLAYADPKGVTEEFCMLGLDVADAEVKGLTMEEWEGKKEEKRRIDRRKFAYRSRYNVALGRHEAYYESLVEQSISLDDSATNFVILQKGELINIEWSHKYSVTEALDLFEQSNLRVVQSWKDPSSEYHLYLLERAPFHFPILPTLSMPDVEARPSEMESALQENTAERHGEWDSVPSVVEWRKLWQFWDTVTLGMIPKELLHQKPIDLRHKCLFYLGHIPTFLDIYLTRVTGGEHSEPQHYKDIFERGIDPHVEDPDQCHDHSIVPEADEDWPKLEEILTFRDRVRLRLLGMYEGVKEGKYVMDRRLGRVLFMVYEHEAMHAETLLYMLLQSPLCLPPPGFFAPQWSFLSEQWAAKADSSHIITFSAPTSISIGHDDKESEDAQFASRQGWEGHEFGWDIENPKNAVVVPPFKIESLPVTNGDFLAFMQTEGSHQAPGSWLATESDGAYQIKTLFGPVDMEVGRHWPVMCSAEELTAFAKWKGGRLPTEGELNALWDDPRGPRPAGRDSNVGLRNWHPVPPTNTKIDTDGHVLHGHNGGVWEWTSTELSGLEGYETSTIYPGFSSDFFDGLHNVVLGGSFATIPRLAARRSWRNFYQAKYPFAWIGGRVAYDA